MSDQVINYEAARSLLEQAGVKFGVAYTSETPQYNTSHMTAYVNEAGKEEIKKRKSRASKSQLRREARNV